MDSSQSSDCFTESADLITNSVTIDTLAHKSLVAKTKHSLSTGISTEINKSTNFTALLGDCYTSINQSLELITSLLVEKDVCINELTEYLSDPVCLLQIFSDFLKNIIESVSMTCCTMKSFPTTTGQIIIVVFTHCKESESLYRQNLRLVEKQLKDLFRNCHELQLTYLMVLEKHFEFDLTVNEEINVLLEALEINLKIGEIVQSLDVKTMAEQWKAYTMICEKYCAVLSQTNVFMDTTQILSLLISNNIKMGLEENQDDKVVVRSLKVASFTIKILLKICVIFKQAERRDYSSVIDLILLIQTCCHLEAKYERQMTNLIYINIITPVECLLKELLTDEIFIHSLVNQDLELIRKSDIFLGYIVTLSSAVRILAKGNASTMKAKNSFIECLYKVLPHCHVYMNLDISIKGEPDQKNNVLENLLINTAMLALSLNNEQYQILERYMIEAILSTQYCCALFSANLWTVIARYTTPQLLFNQLIWLCTIYKKLEKLTTFYRSLQKLYLSYTIGCLFEIMNDEDKMKICKQFRIHDDDNISIWTALGVKNAENIQREADEVVFDKLKYYWQCFSDNKSVEDLDVLIKIINLASTCSFTNTRGIDDFIVKAWLKLCPKHWTIKGISRTTVWFHYYVQALSALTESMWPRLVDRSTNIIKIHHVVTNLIQQCGVEVKLLLTNIFCKLATCDTNRQTNIHTFTCLQHSDEIVQNKLLTILTNYKNDRNLDQILCNTENLTEIWCKIKNGLYFISKDDLINAIDFKYEHKCIENSVTELSDSNDMKRTQSGNFDFAEVEDLFENIEPVSKKMKLVCEFDNIMGRIENDVSLLCDVKENFSLDFRDRIKSVCEKLRNIIDCS